MRIKNYCPAFLFPLLQKAKSLHNILLFNFFKMTCPLDKRKVLFYSVSRQSLSGNLLFIYNRLQEKDLDIKIVVEHDGTTRAELFKSIAQSRYIIVDDYCKLLYPLKMRKNARFIQAWHSTGAFKRMGFSRMGREGSTVSTSLTHRNYTDVIVSSQGVVDNFAEAFGISKDCIHPIGVPRTDVFFDDDYKEKIKEQLTQKCPALREKKLILFAPTFRGNTREEAFYPKEYLDIKGLYDNFGQDYILGLKMHPFIKEKIVVEPEHKSFVIDFSDQREINDLLFVTDTLVTDYSSVIFEYAFLKKPIVFYAPDLEQYTRERDFFYDYSQYIYGSFAKNKQELIEAIKSRILDMDKINEFYSKFLSACDGHCSQRFVTKLMKE